MYYNKQLVVDKEQIIFYSFIIYPEYFTIWLIIIILYKSTTIQKNKKNKIFICKTKIIHNNISKIIQKMTDYYKVLGIPKGSDIEEIKKAYKKLVLENHPDRVQNKYKHLSESEKQSKIKTAQEKMQKINEAYDVLKDPQKKSNYDRFGHRSDNDEFSNHYSHYSQTYTPGGKQTSFQDFFFGNSNSGFASNSQDNYFYQSTFDDNDYFNNNNDNENNKDVFKNASVEIKISLEEWFNGTTTTINYKYYNECKSCKYESACSTCKGTGYIISIVFKITCTSCKGKRKITNYKGCSKCISGKISSNKSIQIQLSRFCHQNLIIKHEGINIRVTMHIMEHKNYKKSGKDIYTTLKVGIKEFIGGAEYNLKYLDGDSLRISYKAMNTENIIFNRKGINYEGKLIIKIKPEFNIGEHNKSEFLKDLNMTMSKYATSNIDSHFRKLV